MSYFFEVDGETVWNPALRVGKLFEGVVRAIEAVWDQPAGWTTTPSDTTEIDVDTFAGFVARLLDVYAHTNHKILRAQLAPVIEVSLVMLERAGRPWPEDDPYLAPFRDYRTAGWPMPV